MKLKDTIHFNWYKNLFVVFLLLVCAGGSAALTGADFSEVFENAGQIGIFMGRLAHPDFSYIPDILNPMLKTLQMSVVGTVMGVLFAIPFAFLATTVVTRNRVVTGVIRFLLDVIRTIPNLLLAALLVAVIGIGEATGVLTIAVFTFGMVSQLHVIVRRRRRRAGQPVWRMRKCLYQLRPHFAGKRFEDRRFVQHHACKGRRIEAVKLLVICDADAALDVVLAVAYSCRNTEAGSFLRSLGRDC